MTAAEHLRSCNANVELAYAALLKPSPEALEGAVPVLRGAVRSLEALCPVLHDSRGDAEALTEAWRLRRTVRRTNTLLANASAYHEGWNDLLAVKTVGYGPRGEPGEPPREGRVCVRA